MPVLLILVAVAILVGVFFVATGRGGELAYERADSAPLDLGPVSATDVVVLRPPTALWGYNMQVTDEALEHIAQAIRDRDVTIAFLQQRLADLTAQNAPEPQPAEPPRVHQAQHARPGVVPAVAAGPPAPEHPADPPAQDDPDPNPARAEAQPDDSTLANQEQTR